jgi:hypothetical protein
VSEFELMLCQLLGETEERQEESSSGWWLVSDARIEPVTAKLRHMSTPFGG